MITHVPQKRETEPTVLCICNHASDGKWGYVLANPKYVGANGAGLAIPGTTNVLMPFWYGSTHITGHSQNYFTARVDNLFVSKKRPPSRYTKYVTSDVSVRPLYEDCIIFPRQRIVELLETLTMEYKYQYVLRCANPANITAGLGGVQACKDKRLFAIVFRVQDVYPPDIDNTDGVYVQVHDFKSIYVEMVFSNTKDMFDIDGLRFDNLLGFNDGISAAEKTIHMLEKLKSGQVPKNKKKFFTDTIKIGQKPQFRPQATVQYYYTDTVTTTATNVTFTYTTTTGNRF